MPVGQSPAAESIYGSEYKAGFRLPPVKFHHQLPSLTLKDEPKLQPRQFPIEPIGPHRRLKKEFECGGPGLGLGTKKLPTIKFLDPKPIVRTPAPQNIVNELPPPLPTGKVSIISQEDFKMRSKLDKSRIEELSSAFKWTTTTRQLMKEATMPVTKITPPQTTLEANADVVKHRPIRLESEPADWQRVAPVWDKIQTRCKTDSKELPSIRKPCIKKSKSKAKVIDVDSGIQSLVKNGQISTHYVRPCPGYAGFVPRSQVEVPPQQNHTNLRTSSTQRASYRLFPLDIYETRKKFAHKAPFSRTVTLTYPFNPFNKVECRKFFDNGIDRPW
ncbi:protein SPMIP7-like [Ptychodera flava]|uniref:protein SPMIP7-like n=1 Tax=Ptychodera flava TaxID=63121 RepID=UPI003969DD37